MILLDVWAFVRDFNAFQIPFGFSWIEALWLLYQYYIRRSMVRVNSWLPIFSAWFPMIKMMIYVGPNWIAATLVNFAISFHFLAFVPGIDNSWLETSVFILKKKATRKIWREMKFWFTDKIIEIKDWNCKPLKK